MWKRLAWSLGMDGGRRLKDSRCEEVNEPEGIGADAGSMVTSDFAIQVQVLHWYGLLRPHPTTRSTPLFLPHHYGLYMFFFRK